MEPRFAMGNAKAFERIIKDSEGVVEDWKTMFFSAASKVIAAEEAVLRYPDDSGLRDKLASAWKEYRAVCRSAGSLTYQGM